MGKFKKGDRVICIGGESWNWAKGKIATVTKKSSAMEWIQVRFDFFDSYGGTDDGHSGPETGFRKLTKLEKALA